MRITLKNDFHNTECSVNLNEGTMTLTQGQLRRIHRELCGSHECRCGWYGIRGPQRGPNGEAIAFAMELAPEDGVGVTLVSHDDYVLPPQENQ